MICGQRNFWIKGFKHMVKHMNRLRFQLFLIIFSYYNSIKCKGIVSIANSTILEKNIQNKRKFSTLLSSNDDSDSKTEKDE